MQTGQSGRPRGVLGGLAPRGSGEGPGEQPRAGHGRGPRPRQGGEVRLAGRGSPFRALCSVKGEVVLTESKGGAAAGAAGESPAGECRGNVAASPDRTRARLDTGIRMRPQC